VEERDGAEPDREGDQVDETRRKDRRQHRLDESCHRRFADPAQAERRDRDAQLGRREIVVEVRHHLL
jgi:hypothetical protein